MLGRPTKGGILFSGGLDSAALAFLLPGVTAITVTLESQGEDLEYATYLNESLNLVHTHRRVTVMEALGAIPEVIRILKSFDPAIPNDLTVYFGLKHAKELGLTHVMTGDGSDEIFAGYRYMETMPDLAAYIRKLSRSLEFGSNRIGNFFGITIHQPFLEKNFLDWALAIGVDLKIREQDGKVWGKWILRHAFDGFLPPKVVWQAKRPLEEGSGMSSLRQIISSMVSDEEFSERGREYPVQFMDKEHFYYYKIFRNKVGEIPPPQSGEKACPGCGAGIGREKSHCRVCGWVKGIAWPKK
ncbi:MAG: Asparagine synthetase B (glutamine-hydrolyzing) [Syntrophorhabdus sp. PtaU1.Bin002]|nr:MAG: Asparagine synthetase B (glutamine-hydrolyzing) [Syntrophorhabdus sp. PtaU1.Bin002]